MIGIELPKDNREAGHHAALQSIREAEANLEARFQAKLRVNPDLDRTLVSFQGNKKETGHRWCKYKEGFSASLIRYALRETGVSEGSLLDPFAGSGTSLFIASEEGMNSVGIELLPCSAEIIDVRRLAANSDKTRLAEQIRSFKRQNRWEKEGPVIHFPHLRITANAFPQETEHLLGRFLWEANKTRDEFLGRILRFAAMCILEVISYTRKDGQYLRWDSRSGRKLGGKPFDKGPIPTFSKAIVSKLDEIVNDLEGRELKLFDFETGAQRGAIDLRIGSCLEILPSLDDASMDAMVTSPPYCNRYDYTRTYALELAMMGVTEEEIRQLRQTMLSCTVENRDKGDLPGRFEKRTWDSAMRAVADVDILSQILEYLEECRVDGSINNSGIPRMVRNYFRELSAVIFECRRILKPGAPLVMVNDNVRYQGAHIPVDLILSSIAEKAGFDIDAIWVLPRGKGNSSQQMGIHGREEIRKCVYVWRVKGRPTKKPGRQLARAR
ncbi:MAG: DNA methyltransferase [Planctomycetota bacterium]